MQCAIKYLRERVKAFYGTRIGPKEGSAIVVPTIPQLCRSLYMCAHICLCSCGPIWTFQRVKEPPAALDKSFLKIDKIVSAVCFPPMELKKKKHSCTAIIPSHCKNKCLTCFYFWPIWARLCFPDSSLWSYLVLSSLLILVSWFSHCIKYCVF